MRRKGGIALNVLKKSDLHVHIWGCYYPEDLFNMARDYYRVIDWNRFDFLDRYEKAFGVRIDPVSVFEEAERTGSIDQIREIAVFSPQEAGSFDRFDVKTFFAVAITGYFIDTGRHELILEPLIKRHKEEGIEYIEYRYSFGSSIFDEWHIRFYEYFRDHDSNGFSPKGIIRLYDKGLDSYSQLRELMKARPDLLDTVVGVDFSGRETAPKHLKPFFSRLRADNTANPEQALDAVAHIGEVFYDKSLESAIRWCHETAELGAKRLGHCIALGIDPKVAIERSPDAHTQESVEERIDQLHYDLAYKQELQQLGLEIDERSVLKEINELRHQEPNEIVVNQYDDKRLREICLRQDFVLARLKELGTVIEVCPTSNIKIGGIPGMEHHPLRKFYASRVNMVICSDDPGVFDSSLSSEVATVAESIGIDSMELAERLGDPQRFRLGIR